MAVMNWSSESEESQSNYSTDFDYDDYSDFEPDSDVDREIEACCQKLEKLSISSTDFPSSDNSLQKYFYSLFESVYNAINSMLDKFIQYTM